MKSEVILCDSCKKMVSNKKCIFCKKDLCDKCKVSMKITLSLDYFPHPENENFDWNEPLKYNHLRPTIDPDDLVDAETIERFQSNCCKNCVNQYKKVKLGKEIKKKVSKILIDYYKRAGLVKAMEKDEDSKENVDIATTTTTYLSTSSAI